MKIEYINCENCGKKIQKRGRRTLCIVCRNIKDKMRICERNKSPEHKEYMKQWHKRRKESV